VWVFWLQTQSLVPLLGGDCPGILVYTGPYARFQTRRRSSKEDYQPLLATTVEKMKNIRLKEQKAFALIREILGRQPSQARFST
jgi:hypothetical protein